MLKAYARRADPCLTACKEAISRMAMSSLMAVKEVLKKACYHFYTQAVAKTRISLFHCCMVGKCEVLRECMEVSNLSGSEVPEAKQGHLVYQIHAPRLSSLGFVFTFIYWLLALHV
jgi:hypothetical protein